MTTPCRHKFAAVCLKICATLNLAITLTLIFDFLNWEHRLYFSLRENLYDVVSL